MRRKKRGDIIIDLTSLLDVIFILLLVVLCNQTVMQMKLQEKIDQANHKEQDYNNTKDLYDDLIDTENHLTEYVGKVSISVPYDEKDVTKRQINILIEGREIESFPLVGNDVSESLKSFEDNLKQYVSEDINTPIIISLNEDEDKILYRDEIMMKEILYSLLEYKNVIIKGSLDGE